MVHPLSYCDIRHGGDPGAARSAVAPSAAPEEGVLVLVPVRGGASDGLFDLRPSLEAAPFEGQRAQDLPPRLDQVQIGRIFGLEYELQRGWASAKSSTSVTLWTLRLSTTA